MEEYSLNLQLAGKNEKLSIALPIPMPDHVVDLGDFVLRIEDDITVLTPRRWTGDVPPYVDRISGERDVYWESQALPPEETNDILMKFVALADAPDEKFLHFAEQYSLLHLCDEHGLPFTHSSCLPSYRERIEHWRRLTRRCHAILHISASLHRADQHTDEKPNLGSAKDWADIDWPAIEGGAESQDLIPRDLSGAKRWLANYVNENIEWTTIQPWLSWDDSSPKIEWQRWTTWDYIAIHLLFRVSGGDFAICMNCQNMYQPSRNPARGKNSYCKACGKRASDRDSKRRKRAKKRDSGQ